MLIQLDNSLQDAINDFAPNEWDALSNIAVAAREGAHYVLASRRLAEALSRCDSLRPRERALYKSIGERVSTMAGIANNVSVSIRIIRETLVTKVAVESGFEIRLPLAFFESSASVQPTILLCENLDDCKLIDEFARLYAASLNRGPIAIKTEMLPGGGATIGQLAEHLLKEKRRFILAIVDSDKRCPQGALGSTARNIRNVFGKLKPIIADLIIINGRELENLLSDAFFLELAQHNMECQRSIHFISAMERSGCDVARRHIDIKNGLLLAQLFADGRQPQDHEIVWNPVITSVASGKLPADGNCIKCARDGACGNPEECICILTEPIGVNLLKRGVETLRRNRREYWRTIPDCLRQAVKEVAQNVFDWGCAASFQST